MGRNFEIQVDFLFLVRAELEPSLVFKSGNIDNSPLRDLVLLFIKREH